MTTVTASLNEFQTVIGAVLPVFCIAGAGALMRRINWLTEEADHSLLKVSINLMIPCLVFTSLLGNEALMNPSNLLVAPLLGFGTIAIGLLVGWAAMRLAGVKDAAGRTFAACVGIYNWGYVPIPLVILLFDSSTLGVLFVFNVGAEAAVWSLGMMMITGASFRSGWKKVINAPMLAIFGTIILNFLGVEGHIPEFLLRTTEMVGQCAIPLGLMLVGATLADKFGEFHAGIGWRVMGVSIALRMGFLAGAMLLLAKFLPVSDQLKQILVIQSAMPTATFPIILAKFYGGDVNTALRVVLGTTAVSLITIPLWIPFGMRFVGV